MTTLTTSPVPVALLTTMANLPLFLVGLPAGALADLVDRRWLVLVTQVWMLAVAALLGVLALTGMMTPRLLLLLTFLIGLAVRSALPRGRRLSPAGAAPPARGGDRAKQRRLQPGARDRPEQSVA